MDRELRVKARRGATYATRCAIGAAAALVAVDFANSLSSSITAGSAGGVAFRTLCWFGLAYTCGAMLFTCDALGAELREGTLGLLRLTPLSSHDIVIGKLVSSGVAGAYGLIAFLPSLALLVLFGGVSGAALIRFSLALINALFFSLGMGLLISAGTSVRLRYLRWFAGAALFLFILPAVFNLSGVTGGLMQLLPWLPVGAFLYAEETQYLSGPASYWRALVVSHSVGWLLVWLAGLRLERTWAESQNCRRSKHSHRPARDAAEAVRSHGSEVLLDAAPIRWLASRTPGNALLVWAGSILFVFTVLVGQWLLPSSLGLKSGLGLLLSLAAAAPFAWLAGRFFFESRRSGELELILSTPLGAANVVDGYWVAVWRQLRGPLLLAGFAVFYQCAFLIATGKGGGAGVALLQLIVMPACRALDVIAVSWVGMWFGLRLGKPSLVIAWTSAVVIGIPWLACSAGMMCVQRQFGGAPPLLPGTFVLPLAIVLMFELAKNLVLIQWAAFRLRTELRTSAAISVRAWLAE